MSVRLLGLTLAGLSMALLAPQTTAQGFQDPTKLPGSRQPGLPRSSTPIECGMVLEDAFDAPGQHYWYSYQGMEGEVIDMTLVKTSGFKSSFPFLSVKTPSGFVLGEVIGTALTTLVLPETGEYGFRVRGTGEGAFALGLGCRPVGPVGLPTFDLATSIEQPGEFDYYVLEGRAGDELRISTVDANRATHFTLAETGAHVVRVQANDLQGTGTYVLGLIALPPDDLFEVMPGDLPLNWSGGTPGEVWFITFDAPLDQVLDLSIGGGTGSLPQLTVFDPLGALVGVFTSDSLTSFTTQVAGTYTVQVSQADPAVVGDYFFGLSYGPPLGPSTPLPCGGLVTGSLMAAETQYYTFDGFTGDVAEITLTKTVGFPGTSAPRMRVFSPGGFDLGAFAADSTNPITLPEDGIYSVRVSANTVLDTGSYDISLLCLPPSGLIHLGDDVIHGDSILAPTELDSYSFQGSAGEVVEIPFVVTSGFNGTAARATLFSPTLVNLGSFNTNTLIEFTLPETGLYTMDVGAANGTSTGSYNIGFERRVNRSLEPDRDPESPPLACGQVIPGSIGSGGEIDYYRFEASAGDTIELTLTGSGFTFPASASARLFSPSNVDLGGFTSNSINAFTLAETGQYSIRINSSNLIGSGSYWLGLACRLPVGSAEGDLSCGDLFMSSIDGPSEVDYWRFGGHSGDIVELTLTGSGFPLPARASARLFSPSNADLGGFLASSLNTFTLPETGQYSVRVNSSNFFSGGNYWIGLECKIPLGQVEGNLACGDVVMSSIDGPSEVDYWTFSAGAGDTIELTLTGSGFTFPARASARLFSPSNADLGGFLASSLNTFTLPETGQYSVRVNSSNFFSGGNYWLGLACRAPLGSAEGNLACGDLIMSSIDGPSEVDYFTFSAVADDSIVLTLAETSGFPTSVPFATVFNPDGSLLGTFGPGSQPFTLPQTGQYAIRINASTLVQTGTYDIALSCL
jgi:hypothetical protein